MDNQTIVLRINLWYVVYFILILQTIFRLTSVEKYNLIYIKTVVFDNGKESLDNGYFDNFDNLDNDFLNKYKKS
jgi:hypothetical protein